MIGSDATPALYAFTLGLVASVNPCGFPLLPAYLALFVDDRGQAGWARRTGQGLLAGISVTTGFVAVFGVLGIVIESGVHVLLRWIPWVMIPLGVALAVVGVLAFLDRSPRLAHPTMRMAGRRGVAAMVGFGVAYAVASLSCALPLFLAGVAGSFTRIGFLAGVATVIAYALGMGLFLMVASLVVAWAGDSALRGIRPLGRFMPRLAGIVLVTVGAYLAYYWTCDLVDPLAQSGPVRLVDQVQTAVSRGLAGSARPIGVALGIVVVAACGVLAWRARRSPVDEPVRSFTRSGDHLEREPAHDH